MRLLHDQAGSKLPVFFHMPSDLLVAQSCISVLPPQGRRLEGVGRAMWCGRSCGTCSLERLCASEPLSALPTPPSRSAFKKPRNKFARTEHFVLPAFSAAPACLRHLELGLGSGAGSWGGACKGAATPLGLGFVTPGCILGCLQEERELLVSSPAVLPTQLPQTLTGRSEG